MAVLCRILIAATLVVHLTVGCCSHHAHACDAGSCNLPAHGEGAHDGQCPESGADHSHHGANDCQGPMCSLVFSSRTVGNLFAGLCQASLAALPDEATAQVVLGHEPCFLSSGRLLLPVRLHLANQVLLI
jgi:hypothetical protein